MIRLPRRPDALARGLLSVIPAVAVFAMAYDNGGYSLTSRTSWAIVVWWGLALAVVVRLDTRRYPDRAPAVVVGAALGALALLTLVSGAWGSSHERAVGEFDRITLYLGVYAVAALTASQLSRARWCDSLAVGIAGVVAVSLISRFAPATFADRDPSNVLSTAATRLSFPVGYWNGLAILAALAVPLLLRAAAAREHAVVRACAVAAVPAVAAVCYLASSRGGFVTTVVGAAAFLALTERRWWAAAAVAAGAAGSAVTLVLLARQKAFVNDPESPLGREQSDPALLAVLMGCFLAGVSFAAVVYLLRGRPAPRPGLGIAAAAAGLAALTAAVVAADPAARLRAFTRPPGEAGVGDDFVRSHLLSVNGSGRWQFWETAIDAFRAKPGLGHGAGSYEAWWAQHGSLAAFVRDAHSLYLETLAELGIAGFALLALAFSVAVATALRRRARGAVDDGADLAAPTAVFAAFAVAAGIDWMWELTVVAVVGFACLGLMLAPRTEVLARRRPSPAGRPTLRTALLLASIALVLVLQLIPYLSETRIRRSQEAVTAGRPRAALDAAESARALQPWAASPWLQVALVREELGRLAAAEAAAREARERDPDDWRLWLVTARLQTKLGRVESARASLRQARALNPRSPLFATLGDGG